MSSEGCLPLGLSIRSLCPRFLFAIRSIPPCKHRWLRPGHIELWCSRLQSKAKANPASWERETSCTFCDVYVKVIAKCQEKIAYHICAHQRAHLGKLDSWALIKQKTPMVWFPAALESAVHAKDIQIKLKLGILSHLANAWTVHSANRPVITLMS